jgi:hypothetical protein
MKYLPADSGKEQFLLPDSIPEGGYFVPKFLVFHFDN